MPTLALATIARDEERGLPRMHRSAARFADEFVVVVDAATSDGTRAVAAGLGARVLERPFDDFARMRAAALAACRSDWVLMLDGDEELEGDPRPLLARGPAIWELPRRHWADLERTRPAPADAGWPDRQARLFPNDPRVRFERPVHEVAKGLRRRRTTDVVLHHFCDALRDAATKEARRRLYRELVDRGRAQGFRYRPADRP